MYTMATINGEKRIKGAVSADTVENKGKKLFQMF